MSSTMAPIAGLAALVVLAASPPPDADAPVHCLDAARQIVSLRPRADCRGEVIDATRAAEVRQRRIELLRRRMGEKPPLVPGRRISGMGTGFVVSDAGHVLTNRHVVEGCAALSVEPVGRAAVVAELVAEDQGLDLAVMRAALPGARPAAFRAAARVALGEPVSIVGYPLHGLIAVKPVRREGRVIRIEAAPAPPGPRYAVKLDVRRGNSGGPVLDARGLVIGVISAKVSTPEVYRATGRLVRDVGLAIEPAAVTGFLARNGVPFRRSARARPLSPEEAFAEAQAYIARIDCWR